MRDERLGESQAHLKVNWIDVSHASKVYFICLYPVFKPAPLATLMREGRGGPELVRAQV